MKTRTTLSIEVADGLRPFLERAASDGDRAGLWNLAAILLPQIGIEIEADTSAAGTCVTGPVFDSLAECQHDFLSRMDETRRGWRDRKRNRDKMNVQPSESPPSIPADEAAKSAVQTELLPASAEAPTQRPAGSREKRLDADDPLFLRFWNAYPNKKGKQNAAKAFEKLTRQGVLSADKLPGILAALERQCRSRDWTKDGGQYIPHPATWLNGRRWEDAEAPDGPPPNPAPARHIFTEEEGQ